jgi:hypothetical protein
VVKEELLLKEIAIRGGGQTINDEHTAIMAKSSPQSILCSGELKVYSMFFLFNNIN